MIKEIEQLIAAKLAALTATGGAALFKTSQRWNSQVSAGAGGKEAFERYSPFAFVKYVPESVDRAGDLDLLRTMSFAVTVGVHGDDARLVAIELLDAVIAAIDRKHPLELYVGAEGSEPTGITCDILLAADIAEILEAEKQYAISVIFEAKRVN